MTIRRPAVVLLLAVLVAGCGMFRRVPNQFYSLQPIRPATAPTSIGGAPIGVDGIELPPGLDRRGVVLRGADGRFEERGRHQWASPLEEMVIHTLAFDLAHRMPEGMVILPGQAKPLGPMRSLYVTFEDLAPSPDGTFVLDARWRLTAPGAPEQAGHERITLPMTSTETPAIITAMNQALATLAERVVGRL